ncbi:MAG TPA: hypothetical protein PK869_06135 [Candidatus Hydrogenedentes bacterium]|nr:hypothetical protein [Candidatus Hydrogenedentota bacterium]
MALTWAIAALVLGADPVHVLDNGSIRIEVEPRLFSIRYIGLSTGENFVAQLSVDPAVADGTEWADAGGLQTDILPYSAKDAAIRRGPAEIVEQSEHYIAMLGPPSEATGTRLKKEILLHENSTRARFRVTAQRVGKENTRIALRNTARLPQRCTMRIERTDGELNVLKGTDSVFPAVVKSRRFWLVPVPPTSEMRGVILGAMLPRVTVALDHGTWTRRIVEVTTDPASVPNGSTLLCLLDDPSKSYAAAMQGAFAELKEGDLLTLEEEWEFERRGR